MISGNENIQKFFQEECKNSPWEFYANCLKSGKLITERTRLEKFVEMLGLESILPNQVRFDLPTTLLAFYIKYKPYKFSK